MSTAIPVALIAACLLPKPIILELGGVLDGAMLIAEVRVLAVEPAPFARGRKGPPAGAVKIRVTANPGRIVTGFAHIGRELDLLPVGYGAASCTAELKELIDDREEVLLVVDSKRQVTLIGRPVGGAESRTYELHGWCDFNAVLFRCDDAELKRQCKLNGTPSQVAAPGHALARRLEERRDAVLLPAVDRWLGARPALSPEDYRRAVAELREAGATGDAALAALRRDGGPYIEELTALREQSLQPRAKTRLGDLVDSLEPHRVAAEVVRASRRAGPATEAGLLLEMVPRLDAKRHARTMAHLLALASAAVPAVELPAAVDDSGLMKAWRQRLQTDVVGIAPAGVTSLR